MSFQLCFFVFEGGQTLGLFGQGSKFYTDGFDACVGDGRAVASQMLVGASQMILWARVKD